MGCFPEAGPVRPFSSESAEDLLARELTPERFALRAKDEPLYAEFPGEGELAYVTRLARGVGGHGAELDGYIEKYAKGWRFSRILYMPDVPNKVAINEAVEIAKKYLDDDVVKFINGILGSFVRAELPEQE